MDVKVNGQHMTSFLVGSNLSMLCSAQSSPPARLHWAFRGELVNRTGPLLELLSVTQEQSGPYSCMAFNNHTNMHDNITTHIMITSEFVTIEIMIVHLFPNLLQFYVFADSAMSRFEKQAVRVWLLPLLFYVGFLLSLQGKMNNDLELDT